MNDTNADANVRDASPRVAPVGHDPIANGNATATSRDASPRVAPVGHSDDHVTGQSVARVAPVGHGDRLATDQSVLAHATRVGHGRGLGAVSGVEREQLAAGFGRRVAELRAARKLSQEKAAAKARVTQGYWSQIENGRRRPSADLVALLALVLADGDPWPVLDELLGLGGTALSGSGRRRFRTEANRALSALVQLERMQAVRAGNPDRLLKAARKAHAAAKALEERGADRMAEVLRGVAADTERLAERASAPRTSPQVRADKNGRAPDVRTPPSILDRFLGGE